MARTLRYLGLIVAVPLVLLACGSPPEPIDPSFDRRDFLVEAIEDELASDSPVAAVNLVTQGRSNGMLDTASATRFLERVARAERSAYDTAERRGDYARALRAVANLELLARETADDLPELEGLRSSDQLLLDWASGRIEDEEPVQALYLLLRRSTLGDLDTATAERFRDIARTLNHHEAYARLSRVLQRTAGGESTEPADLGTRNAAQMLAGTVTVWVNRGIRLEQGVGVPDRVIGSGFFVDPRGYLLTNYHVISSEVDPEYEGFSRLFIKLPGRPDQRIPARVIGFDRIFDLALLKVEIDPAYVFSLSDTRELTPGEQVFALGSPGGLDSTVTSGIVSAPGRRFLQMGEAVQVDVPINPGNSGGPLVLPDGQVAGVVFAGIEQFEGVNFAIPSYWIRHFFTRLYEEGEVLHPWLGIAVSEVDDGLQVVYVAPDSPAAHAGITVGETLVGIDGQEIGSITGAQDAIMARQPGTLVSSVWMERNVDGGVSTARRLIALDERPFSPVEEALERQPIERLFPVLYGMDVDAISAAPWGPDYVITEVLPGSIADESSLSVDDPFALRNWRVDRDLRAAFIQIVIKKRKAGFLESGVQLGAFLETDTFL